MYLMISVEMVVIHTFEYTSINCVAATGRMSLGFGLEHLDVLLVNSCTSSTSIHIIDICFTEQISDIFTDSTEYHTEC